MKKVGAILGKFLLISTVAFSLGVGEGYDDYPKDRMWRNYSSRDMRYTSSVDYNGIRKMHIIRCTSEAHGGDMLSFYSISKKKHNVGDTIIININGKEFKTSVMSSDGSQVYISLSREMITRMKKGLEFCVIDNSGFLYYNTLKNFTSAYNKLEDQCKITFGIVH